MVKPIKLMSEHFVAMSDPDDRERFRFAPHPSDATIGLVALKDAKLTWKHAWKNGQLIPNSEELEAVGLEEARCVLSTLEDCFENAWHRLAWNKFSALYKDVKPST